MQYTVVIFPEYCILSNNLLNMKQKFPVIDKVTRISIFYLNVKAIGPTSMRSGSM